MVRTAVFIGPASFGPASAGDNSAVGEDAPLGGWPALDRVPERIAELNQAFTRLGYACTTLDGALTAEEMGLAVRTAIRRSDPADVLVVHVFSHGEVTASGALHVIGADGVRHELTDVERWLRNIVDAGPAAPITLFLLDICYAGAAARFDWLTRTGSADGRAWVIAACAPYELAYAGRFTDAVTEVLRELADGRLDIDESFPNAPITTIAQQIRRDVTRRAARADGLPQQVTASLIDISSTPPDLPFFPNLRHRENPRRDIRTRIDTAIVPFLEDVDEALDPAHFIGRAAGQGSNVRGPLTGCFSGRGEQVKELAPWLNLQDRVGLRVVTGSPGAGKSALIGVLVCAAHPALRENTRPVWDRLEQRPYPNYNMAAVHARERTTAQVTASIARQLGAPADDLVAGLAARPQPPVIVVDALDEAIDGKAIMNEVLLPLTRATRADGQPIRVLVGMRPWDEFRPLREAAEAAGGLHDLDQVDPDQLCDDVEEYVGRLMRADDRWKGSAYVGAGAAFAREVAEALTLNSPDREWGAFLVAGLFAYHVLNTRAEPIRDIEEVVTLARTVPRTLPELLELDLQRQPSPRQSRWLLKFLAHARGEGMPVTAVTYPKQTNFRDQAATPDELSAVGFYLRRSADVDGTTLYRLFHQGLADHLRSPDMEPLIFGALSRSVTPPARPPQWDLATPYIRRHLASHAGASGALVLLIRDPGFLVAADPGPLLAELDAWPADEEFLATVSAYRLAATGTFATDDRQQRRQALTIAAARSGAPRLALALATLPYPDPLAWQPLWVVTANVTAVATQDAIAVLGTAEGDIVVLSLDTAEIIREHRTVHEGAVWALCIGAARGGPVALSAGMDQVLAVSALDSADVRSMPIDITARLLAAGDLGGREMAVAVDRAGVATLWDLATNNRVAALDWKPDLAEGFTVGDDLVRLHRNPHYPNAAIAVVGGRQTWLSHEARVTAAGGGGIDGTPVVCTGDAEGVIRAWSIVDGTVLDSLRLPGLIVGLHITDRGEVLAGVGGEVYAFRFRPSGPSANPRPVRRSGLRPGAPGGLEHSLRWAPLADVRGSQTPMRPPRATSNLIFRYAAKSVAGDVRTVNCDASYAGPRFLAVADGIDAASSGDVASRIVLRAMASLDLGEYPDGADAVLRTAVAAAQVQLRDAGRADRTLLGTGTTLSAAIISGAEVTVAHIGDSRIYLLRAAELSQITSDDSVVQSSDPSLSHVLSAMRRTVPLTYRTIPVSAGDRLLLCTRGLSNVVFDTTLAEILTVHQNPREVTDRLISLALRDGAPENVTAVVADVVAE